MLVIRPVILADDAREYLKVVSKRQYVMWLKRLGTLDPSRAILPPDSITKILVSVSGGIFGS